MHYHIPHSIVLVPGAPLPNGLIYVRSPIENESIPYVQYISIGHDHFQVCLGFQPLSPIDISLPGLSSPIESSHTQTEVDHVARIVECIQHLQQQVHDILQ
jgi:hypothetical protein